MNVYKRMVPAVVILLLTVLIAGMATVPAVAQSPTSVTIKASTTTPAPYQYVTFTATLTSGGTPLSGKPVAIYHYVNGVRYYDTTKNSDANGQIKFAKSWASAAQLQYYAAFAANSSYAASTSSEVMINVISPTKVTLTTSNDNPAPGESFTLSGNLTADGAALSGKTIQLLRVDPDGEWSYVGTITTLTNGSYTFTRSESSPGPYGYQVSFAGDASYAPTLTSLDLTVE